MRYEVRAAVPADADDLGRVHVRAWRAAYSGGLMPDEYLDGLSESERATNWRDALQRPPQPRAARLVAESEHGSVEGFALVGPVAEDDADPDVGELYAINMDPEHWGTGAAGQLFASATEALRAAGFSSAVLWVHPDNQRARAFYESHGWSPDGVERVQAVLGVTVPEVRYAVAL